MKLVATLVMGREDLATLIEDKVRSDGYILEGAPVWDEAGGVELRVRPMTAEEREAYSVATPPTAADVMGELHIALGNVSVKLGDRIQRLQKEIDKNFESMKVGLETQGARSHVAPKERVYGPGPAPEPPPLSFEPSPDVRVLPTDPTGEGAAKARIARIRAEQEKDPDLYAGRRDAEGFVVFKNKR